MRKSIKEESARLNEILAPYRDMAYDAVTDIMLEAMIEMAAFMRNEESDEGWIFDRQVCGFKARQLGRIYTEGKVGGLVPWVSELPQVERFGLITAFLDYERIRMLEFRQRYPNSFMRWSPADDESLLEMYSHRQSWSDLADHFGRNVNAVKLRLQHLGVDLGSDSGRSRYLRRGERA